MWIFIGGMIRSGSTLEYDIAIELAVKYLGGITLGYQEVAELDSLLRKDGELIPAPEVPTVVKTHVCTPDIQSILKGDSGAKAFYTYRDLRDVTVSAKRQFKLSFEDIRRKKWIESSIVDYFLWTGCSGVEVTSYVDLIGDRERAVSKIAEHLGIEISGDEVSRIAEKFSPEQQRLRQPDEEAEGKDGSLELHPGHVGKGAVGAWKKDLPEEEVKELEQRFGGWMKERGFELSDAGDLCSYDSFLEEMLREQSSASRLHEQVVREKEAELKRVYASVDELVMENELLQQSPLKRFWQSLGVKKSG